MYISNDVIYDIGLAKALFINRTILSSNSIAGLPKFRDVTIFLLVQSTVKILLST